MFHCLCWSSNCPVICDLICDLFFPSIERLDSEPWWLLFFQPTATADRGSNYSFNRIGPTSHWICKTAWDDCVNLLNMNPLTANSTLTLDGFIIIQCYLIIHNLNIKNVLCGTEGFPRTGAIKYTQFIIYYSVVPGMSWHEGNTFVCAHCRVKHVFNKVFVRLLHNFVIEDRKLSIFYKLT